MIIFVLIVFSILEKIKCRDHDGILFRIHGKFFMKLDICSPLNVMYSLAPYGIVTSPENNKFLIKTCNDSTCSHECYSRVLEFDLNDFEPYPTTSFLSPISTRILETDVKNPSIGDNSFLTLQFVDGDTCENIDLTKATGFLYSGDKNFIMKCADITLFNPSGQKNSKKCFCDEETHALRCKIYNETNTCEGKWEFEESHCDTSFSRQVCGEDLDLSKIGGTGVHLDFSSDVFIKDQQYVDKNECVTITVKDDYIKQIKCDSDCHTNCGEVFYQDYLMEKDVAVNTYMLLFINQFSSFFYAYERKNLEIAKGEKNDRGYYDTRSDQEEGLIIYGYSQSDFVFCDHQSGKFWECSKDGSVTETKYENRDCTGNYTREVLKSLKCGKLPHHLKDIEDSSLSTGEIIAIVAGGVVALGLLCCCCCCCCIFLVFVVSVTFFLLVVVGGGGGVSSGYYFLVKKKGYQELSPHNTEEEEERSRIENEEDVILIE